MAAWQTHKHYCFAISAQCEHSKLIHTHRRTHTHVGTATRTLAIQTNGSQQQFHESFNRVVWAPEKGSMNAAWMNASADDCASVGVYAVCACVARHMIMFMKLTHTHTHTGNGTDIHAVEVRRKNINSKSKKNKNKNLQSSDNWTKLCVGVEGCDCVCACVCTHKYEEKQQAESNSTAQKSKQNGNPTTSHPFCAFNLAHFRRSLPGLSMWADPKVRKLKHMYL